MPSPPYNLDITEPQLTDIVSTYPANEQNFRAIVSAWLNQIADATTGWAFLDRGSTAVRNAIVTPPVGMLFYNGDTGSIDVQTGVPATPNWKPIAFDPPTIPAGTITDFFQAAAPTGWTQVVTQNDKVLRVVSGAGAGSGGSWTISGTTVTPTVNSHTLTVTEIPAHTHGVVAAGQGSRSDIAGSSNLTLATTATATLTTDNGTGGGGGHTHTATATFTNDAAWRPAYIDVLIASKN